MNTNTGKTYTFYLRIAGWELRIYDNLVPWQAFLRRVPHVVFTGLKCVAVWVYLKGYCVIFFEVVGEDLYQGIQLNRHYGLPFFNGFEGSPYMSWGATARM